MASSVPSVLVVLMARNGAAWLRECLEGLSAQTYQRLGVVGVDSGSTDDSRDLLVQALGEGRVIDASAGAGAALAEVVKLDAAQAADYFLLLHDDAALDPDAVERLVEAAEAVEEVGVVGAKFLDWDTPRVLQDIGWAADRFGHPYSPLESGEIDQGQYDRIREVLFVSDAVMLISQPAAVRAGLPDERLGPHDEELDYCWRMRLAGFRVLMSPMAVVRHRDATKRGERSGDRSADHRRYYEERGAVVAISKNYGLGSVWVLPIYVIQGLVKLLALGVARRFNEAGDLVAAWGWHTVHFPGTVLRRVKAQSVRSVKDREIHRYMAHGSVRLRRWLDAAGRVLPGEVEVPEEEDTSPSFVPLHERASSAARGHPVAAAWVLTAFLIALAYRHFVGPAQLTGGGLPAVLPSPGDFFAELDSGVRTTVLGGAQAASPALGAIGATSYIPFVSVAFVEKILLLVLPLLCGMSMYRMALRVSGHRVAALAAGGFYALSPLVLWTFSTGRIPALVLLAVLPKLGERLAMAFGPVPPARRWRFIVGTGVFAAVALAFYPGAALSLVLLLLASFLVPERAGRRFGGLGLSIGFAVVGAALVFPLVVDIVSQGEGLGTMLGIPDVTGILRLVLVPGKGDWVVSWFLPAVALVCFGLASSPRRAAAFRYMLAALAGLGLAWSSAAGWLPDGLSDATAYLAVAAVSYCALVAIGLASVLVDRPRLIRRMVSALMVAAVIVGLGGQALLAASGSWDVGRRKLEPAWPLVSSETGDFRVLWIGGERGRPFPAPGGDPMRSFMAGDDSLQYSVTDRDGISALDIARAQEGAGYGYLDATLAELLSGDSRHAGAMLGPLGIRYVVAAEGDVPPGVVGALERQVDMDLVPAGGLLIYRNESDVPPAAVIAGPEYAALPDTPTPGAAAGLPPVEAAGSLTKVEGGWDGASNDGTVSIGQQYEPGWRLYSGAAELPAERTLGWAITFMPPAGGASFEIRYADQSVRTFEMIALGVLWLGALWMTRKPARR